MYGTWQRQIGPKMGEDNIFLYHPLYFVNELPMSLGLWVATPAS